MSLVNYGKQIFLMVLGILGIILGTIILIIVPFHILNYGGGMIPFTFIPGGIFLMIISLIGTLVKKERQKKFESMSSSDVFDLFEDSIDDPEGIIKFIKLEKDQILVRQRSDNRGRRLLRIPIRFKDQCISHFRDNVFRCFKCGKESPIDHVKHSGPFTLVKLSCSTHGRNIPYHKIWSTVYNEISNEGIKVTQPGQTLPIPSKKIKFCPNCGEEFQDPDQTGCLKCGFNRGLLKNR
ncbi:MAG: hypothetical protein ACXADU_09830 [Promethearchaeota archaeon]|jgi:hypothetical protein